MAGFCSFVTICFWQIVASTSPAGIAGGPGFSSQAFWRKPPAVSSMNQIHLEQIWVVFFFSFFLFSTFSPFQNLFCFFFFLILAVLPQKRVLTDLRSPFRHEARRSPEAQLCRILLETAAPGDPWSVGPCRSGIEGFLRLALPETSSNHICLWNIGLHLKSGGR